MIRMGFCDSDVVTGIISDNKCTEFFFFFIDPIIQIKWTLKYKRRVLT